MISVSSLAVWRSHRRRCWRGFALILLGFFASSRHGHASYDVDGSLQPFRRRAKPLQSAAGAATDSRRMTLSTMNQRAADRPGERGARRPRPRCGRGQAAARRHERGAGRFRRAAVRPRRAGGPGRLRGPTSLRRWPREAWAFLARAQARRAENPLRIARCRGRRASQVDLGDRDRQRRHAVPGRFGDGRTDRARPRRRAWSRIRSSAVERDKAGKLTAPPTEARRATRTRRARASSISMSSASTTRRAAPRSCRRWSRCWPRCGAACRTGGRCSAASAR